MSNVSPGTQYTAMVTAASSSNISPGVSRMINTNDSGETCTCTHCLLLLFVWVLFLGVKVASGFRLPSAV